jgi:LacI family transcriptional regulator
MQTINLKTLANELKLSVSTISKALNDSYEIKESTKKRVREMAEKLNYQPNHFGSNLRNQTSRTIAVVIPEIVNNFFSLVMDGIQSIATTKGYHVLTYITHDSYKNECAAVKYLKGGRVDGVIMSLCSQTVNNDHLLELKEAIKSLVFFDRTPKIDDCPTISVDNYESSYNATEYLIQKGCKKIAYLGIPQDHSIGHNRKRGFLDALNNNNVAENKNLIVEFSIDGEKEDKILSDLLIIQKPDGIFSSVETLAIATYHACRHLGIKIPEDIKIISFSNLRTASLLNPSLSTISQPAFEIGQEACETLIRKIEGKNFMYDDHIILKNNLIYRDSSS